MNGDSSVSERRQFAQEQLTAFLDITLGLLALAALCLLLLEITTELPQPWAGVVVETQVAIWVALIVGFAVELTLAPSKAAYLRSNWVVVLSLALPALRVFRVARAFRLLRSTRAIRALGLANVGAAFSRASRALREFFAASRFAYLVGLTIVVVLTSGLAVHFFEQGHDSTIESVSDGLWWAATLVTTVNSELEAESLEGRLISLALRLYGFAVFGYLVAQLAAQVLGGHQAAAETSTLQEVNRKLDELQARLAALSPQPAATSVEPVTDAAETNGASGHHSR